MKSLLDHATCARIPAASLEALAALRPVPGVSILREGDHAWVFWEPGEDQVLRAVLPVPGSRFYERRGETWYRLGHHLPSFGEPPEGETIPLVRAITPEPFTAEGPGDQPIRPVRLRLERAGRPQVTSAALCPLSELARWADRATSSELAAIRGAISGTSALLIGPTLPVWAGSTRYWGRLLLVPIGFEPRPALPETMLRPALGASDRELVRLVPGPEDLMVEMIPLEAFEPLTRAGVRLASPGERTG